MSLAQERGSEPSAPPAAQAHVPHGGGMQRRGLCAGSAALAHKVPPLQCPFPWPQDIFAKWPKQVFLIPVLGLESEPQHLAEGAGHEPHQCRAHLRLRALNSTTCALSTVSREPCFQVWDLKPHKWLSRHLCPLDLIKVPDGIVLAAFRGSLSL